VSGVVEREIFDKEVKSECKVEEKGETMRLPHRHLVVKERTESKKLMKKGFSSQKEKVKTRKRKKPKKAPSSTKLPYPSEGK